MNLSLFDYRNSRCRRCGLTAEQCNCQYPQFEEIEMERKMSEQTSNFHEAPASANVRVTSPAGYGWQLTSRANSMNELLERLPTIETWLAKHNWQPAHGHPAAAPQAGNGNGQATGTAPLCPTHGTPMKPSKHGGWYCPAKMGDGSYCKEKRD